jgi:squalene cyclase
MLQALAVHPRYARSSEMHLAAGWLAQRQEPGGSWTSGIPFYPTLYALSHVRGKHANAQFNRALDRAVRTQNSDGSWGGSQRQLCTFLVLSATKNRGLDV